MNLSDFFSFSVWDSARSIQAPHSCSEGHPAPKYPAVTAPFPADSRERDWAPGNADPHPGSQQSPDRLGSTQGPGARERRRDGDAGRVGVASVLWIGSNSLWPVQLPSLQRRPEVRRWVVGCQDGAEVVLCVLLVYSYAPLLTILPLVWLACCADVLFRTWTIHRFADSIIRYCSITDMSVFVFIFCFSRPEKKALTNDLKLCNNIICPADGTLPCITSK